MVKTINTFRKYLICPLGAKGFGEKYINGVKYYLYLRGKLNIFEKSW